MLQSAARKAKHWDSARRKMVDVGLQLFNQELWVMKTVDELLFSGYKDELIDMARVMHIFGKDVEVPFDKFGWFYPVQFECLNSSLNTVLKMISIYLLYSEMVVLN